MGGHPPALPVFKSNLPERTQLSMGRQEKVNYVNFYEMFFYSWFQFGSVSVGARKDVLFVSQVEHDCRTSFKVNGADCD